MFKNFLGLTFKSLRYRSIRSWLTILGIVIGIMLVVIILSLGDGIQSAVRSVLQSFGSDLIVIFPGKESNPIVGLLGGQKFREKDLIALESIEGVEFVVPMETAMVNIEYKGEKKSTMLHAANWENYVKVLESSQGIRLEKGEWPQSDDTVETVFGYRAANALFNENVPVGSVVVVNSRRFRVTGHISEIGEQMLDNVIFVSMKIFRDLTGKRSGAATALIKIDPGAEMNLVAKQIEFQLGKQEVVRDFSVLTPDKADRLSGNVLSIIELILIVIALVSLIVGAIGIMNTMYTSVLERTKQIGIMKAVGASNETVLSLFLIESGMIGLGGGVLGIVFGTLSAYFISLVAVGFGIRGLFSFASLDFFGLFVILFLTFIVGVISGVLPARQAAEMEPADALRYE